MITNFGQFGTNDFIEYWTAFRLFISHQNPYDPQLMLDLQQQLGCHTNTPLMMWNPPWLLVIMAPVLMLGFGAAATAWIYVNFAFLAGIVFFSVDLAELRTKKFTAVLLSLPLLASFLPLYESFRIGQLGVLLGFLLIGGIWAIERKRTVTAGLFISLWTLKVHLFIPLAMFLFFRSLRNRNFFNLILSATCWLTAFAFITTVISRNALPSWIAGMRGKTAGGMVETVDQWIGPSLTGGLRLLLEKDGLVPVWPIITMPGLAAMIAAITAIWFGPRLRFLTSAILMVLLGILLAPFGWLFDLTAILPLYLMALLSSLQKIPFQPSRHVTIFVLFFSQLLCWLQYLFTNFNGQHHYLWLPIVLVMGLGWHISRMTFKYQE